MNEYRVARFNCFMDHSVECERFQYVASAVDKCQVSFYSKVQKNSWTKYKVNLYIDQ